MPHRSHRSEPMTDQGLQITAALLLLVSFGLSQLKLLHVKSLAFLLCNTIGSEVLAMAAWAGHQWGVLVVEGAWSLISAAGLAGTLGAVLDRRGRLKSVVLQAPPNCGPGVPTRLGR